MSLSLFNILRFPMSMLPYLISSLVEADVSRRRVTNFLLLDEVRGRRARGPRGCAAG